MDRIDEAERADVLLKKKIKISELTKEVSPELVIKEIFGTSIWDESLYKVYFSLFASKK